VRVRGNVRPLRLNPEPDAVACEIVALALPELVSVAVWLCVVPTATFPKVTLAGAMAICPGVVPSPDTVTTALVGADCGLADWPCTAFMVREAAPLTDTFPVTSPADLGANVSVKVVLWPAESVRGRVSPLKVNAALLDDAWEMVTLDPPGFVRVAVCA